MDNDIIISAEFEKLKNEIKKLRVEISMLLLEKDNLKLVECKNIQTLYMIEFGALEHNVYKAQCNALRLKRKIELIQAKKNRQELYNISDIEKILDDEFAEYKEKLNEQIHKMNEAIDRSKAGFMTEEQAKEHKKLYRTVVKALHPDLNPNITKEQLGLFERAVNAYENGDTDLLRIICEMVSDNSNEEISTDSISYLTEEKTRLESKISVIQKEIDKIKSEFPYNVKEILESKEKIQEYKNRFTSMLNYYNQIIEMYKKKLGSM